MKQGFHPTPARLFSSSEATVPVTLYSGNTSGAFFSLSVNSLIQCCGIFSALFYKICRLGNVTAYLSTEISSIVLFV